MSREALTYAEDAVCSCGHPQSVHLRPDDADHDGRPCFVLGCRCEALSLVCVVCGRPEGDDGLISGLWCDVDCMSGNPP